MPNYCCITGCKSLVTAHQFPTKNEALKKQWIHAIQEADPKRKLRDWQPTKNSTVCRYHFTPDDFTTTILGERRRLKSNAVPKLFLHKPGHISEKMYRKRVKEIMKARMVDVLAQPSIILVISESRRNAKEAAYTIQDIKHLQSSESIHRELFATTHNIKEEVDSQNIHAELSDTTHNIEEEVGPVLSIQDKWTLDRIKERFSDTAFDKKEGIFKNDNEDKGSERTAFNIGLVKEEDRSDGIDDIQVGSPVSYIDGTVEEDESGYNIPETWACHENASYSPEHTLVGVHPEEEQTDSSDDPTLHTNGSDDPTLHTNRSDDPTLHTNGSDDPTLHTNRSDDPTLHTNHSDDPTLHTNRSDDPTLHTNRSDDPTLHTNRSDKSGTQGTHVKKQRKIYSCGICGHSGVLSRDLNEHMKIHTVKNPYTCCACTMIFSRAGALMNHMRKHIEKETTTC